MIDHTTTDVTTGGRRYDLIVDIGGRHPICHLRRILAARGTLVVVGGEDGGRITGGFGRGFRGAALSPFTRQRLRVLVAKEAAADLERLASGHRGARRARRG